MSRCLLASLCIALLTLDANASLAADLPTLIANLESPDANVRFDAAFEIARLGPAAKDAVPTLLKMLKEDQTGIVEDALVSIGSASVPGLMELWTGDDGPVSHSAANALMEIGPGASSAASDIMRRFTLQNEDPFLCRLMREDPCGVASFSSYPSPADLMAAMEAKALPKLRQGLRDDNANVRGGAAFALGLMKAAGKDAAPDLLAALKAEPGRPSATVKCSEMFIWALGKIGPGAHDAKSDLQALLARRIRESLPWRERFRMLGQPIEPEPMEVDIEDLAEALVAVAPGDVQTLKLLGEGTASDRLGFVRHTTKMWNSFGGDGVVVMASVLQNTVPKSPDIAGLTFSFLSLEDAPNRERALGALIGLLHHSDHSRSAICLLGEIGPAAFPAIPRLMPLLWSSDRQTRLAAAGAIVRIQPILAYKAFDVLAKGLQSTDPQVQKETLWVIEDAGKGARSLLGRLIPLLTHRNDDIRLGAIEAIGAMGPAANSAVPELLRSLRNRIGRDAAGNRNGELYALAKIGTSDAVMALERLLSDSFYSRDALLALEHMGSKAAPTIDTLIGILQDPAKSDSHLIVLRILQSIGPDAKRAIPTLKTFERSHDRRIRHDSRDAIKAISK